MKRILYAILFLIAVMSASAQQPKPQTASVANQAATGESGKAPTDARPIRGRVVADGGQPLADVSIMILPADPSANRDKTLSNMLRPNSTDSDGRFEISDVPLGAYQIMAFAIGYVEADFNVQRYYRPGDIVTLSMLKGGVITGQVTNSAGSAVVGARVRAVRVRDSEGRRVRAESNPLASMFSPGSFLMGDWQTDDRGIYRIYGLEPGVYHVAAGGKRMIQTSVGGYDGDVPTYFPSSTHDTASEVIVRAGEEVTNIDIRYRGGQGHAISGTVTGPAPSGPASTVVQLARAPSGIIEATAIILPNLSKRAFMFDAVSDGDYYITAIAASANALKVSDDNFVSKPRRVTVKGVDVSGVDIVLIPFGSISGRVTVEPAQKAALGDDCKNRKTASLEEVVIFARPDENHKEEPLLNLSLSSAGTPDDKGEFAIRLLESGLRRLEMKLPGERWYISAITQPSPVPKGKPIDAARDGIRLKPGEHVKGLTVTLSEGSASLIGRVVSAQESKPLPARLRVYLAPAEKEAADDVLRYFEAEVKAGGAFEITHIAPGRYWLVARPVSDEEFSENESKPLAWEASGRTGLRFEGEAINTVIELKPCQKMADYTLRYTPPIAPTTPAKKKGE